LLVGLSLRYRPPYQVEATFGAANRRKPASCERDQWKRAREVTSRALFAQ
jgi:hypothetical protein